MSILPSTLADIPSLLSLINSAYRGESARRGWAHEADLIEGPSRIDEPALRELMETPDAVLLKYVNDAGDIQACVFLHKKERGLYLGVLTVSPDLQGAGIGKLLMTTAEAYAREQGCRSVFMNVLSLRESLIAWYERHGYQRTGETMPFTPDPRFGVPIQPLQMVVLEKVQLHPQLLP